MSASAPVAVEISLCVLTINQGRLAVLATRNTVSNTWAFPGCTLIGDETCDVVAEQLLLAHEPHRETTFLEQLRTYGPHSTRDGGSVLSVAYVALVAELHAKSQSSTARVFALDDLAGSGFLAEDQERILADGVERVRAKFEYTTAATSLVVEPFTIPELRRVYESAWGVPLHPANFRRKVLTTPGFVERVTNADNERGPELYRRGTASLLHPAMLRPSEVNVV
jgi:8-oxo-dGTP diphosphatase